MASINAYGQAGDDLQVLIEHKELAAGILHLVLAEVLDQPSDSDGLIRLHLGWKRQLVMSFV